MIRLEEHNSTRLQIELVPLPTNVISNFPCVGTVLRVIADQAACGFQLCSSYRLEKILFLVDLMLLVFGFDWLWVNGLEIEIHLFLGNSSIHNLGTIQ